MIDLKASRYATEKAKQDVVIAAKLGQKDYPVALEWIEKARPWLQTVYWIRREKGYIDKDLENLITEVKV